MRCSGGRSCSREKSDKAVCLEQLFPWVVVVRGEFELGVVMSSCGYPTVDRVVMGAEVCPGGSGPWCKK